MWNLIQLANALTPLFTENREFYRVDTALTVTGAP